MKLRVKNISFSYKKETPLLKNISFDVAPGEFVGILGPNGCGKTTLLKIISGVIAPDSGFIYLDKRKLTDHSPQELARMRSVVPQEAHLEFDFTVRDVVSMGRLAYAGLIGEEVSQKKVEEALELCELNTLQHRNACHISGGEWQRVLIARAFAQDTPIVLLDEPTHFLDLHNKASSIRLLQTMSRQGKTIIAVLHDISIAQKICSKVILLKDGTVSNIGSPKKILTTSAIAELYGVSKSLVKFFS